LDHRKIADEALAALGTGRQVEPYSARRPPIALADAYRVARAIRDMRAARGEAPVGRKIGFTNRSAWVKSGAQTPVWSYIYASTVHDLGSATKAALTGLPEPRIEPEIVLGLARAPSAEMDERALAGCVGWVAHGFEIVQSLFPDWAIRPEDAAIGFGMHASLWIGQRRPFAERAPQWIEELPVFRVELSRDGAPVERGVGANVLDGPLTALRALVAMLATDPHNPPLAAGEIVTTGTLTAAPPIAPGEVWMTRLTGIPLPGLRLALSA